ncbi:MAG: 3-oxoacyl-ACP synthase III [Candidatus Wallbacteria bacterium]|nr:3-oxoacyl-ACP synthase III [Candidatus Wallbacteria bacterium]
MSTLHGGPKISMLYDRVHIESLAHELPPLVVTSEQLEERIARCYEKLGMKPGFLREKTGIGERRLWERGDLLSRSASSVARLALDRTNLQPHDIGAIVVCSISHENVEPATAVICHENLGLPYTADAHDITNACAGWVNGLLEVANKIQLGQIKAGIVVTSEDIYPALDATIKQLNDNPAKAFFEKTFATLTMGSGAAAAVLTDRSISSTEHRFLGATQMTFSQHNRLCRLQVPDGPVLTDCWGLLMAGLEPAKKCWEAFQSEVGWKSSDVGLSLFHQVSRMHRDLMCDNLGLSKETNPTTFERLGNIGTCTVPITWSLAQEQGLLQTGQKIAINSIGSGIVVIMGGAIW